MLPIFAGYFMKSVLVNKQSSGWITLASRPWQHHAVYQQWNTGLQILWVYRILQRGFVYFKYSKCHQSFVCMLLGLHFLSPWALQILCLSKFCLFSSFFSFCLPYFPLQLIGIFSWRGSGCSSWRFILLAWHLKTLSVQDKDKENINANLLNFINLVY